MTDVDSIRHKIDRNIIAPYIALYKNVCTRRGYIWNRFIWYIILIIVDVMDYYLLNDFQTFLSWSWTKLPDCEIRKRFTSHYLTICDNRNRFIDWDNAY